MSTDLTENCRRCNARGYLEIRLGLASQDPRELPNGLQDVKWGTRYPPTVCNVCDGSGTVSKPKLRKGSYQILNSDQLDPYNMKEKQ